MSTQSKTSQNKQANVAVFGNKDKDQKYPITQDAIDKGRYVLLHFKNHTYPDPNNTNALIDTGDMDSSSMRIGVYTQRVFNEYTRENEKEQKVNTFNRMGGKYIVLHDPTIEAPKAAKESKETKEPKQPKEPKAPKAAKVDNGAAAE